ncbi:P-loop containing nucleoside triphosphate hydrolase protein [Hysterangium stoloniferum]|nr:P-loop containing nucleoside triphosphate hydrolase protein [Hysterangium stoloniferum]
MPSLKRKRAPAREASLEVSEIDEVPASDGEIDISLTLVGRHKQGNDEGDDEDFIRKTMTKHNVKSGTEVLKKTKGKNKMTKGEVGGGSFQSMGLHPTLLRSLTLRGYRVPTPIQRLTIPTLLSTPPRDVVGMARTGSGKTLAYMIPLIQRLGGRHSTSFGARALIMVPARELALQVLKVGKELARGWTGGGGDHAGDAEGSEEPKGQSLRWGLVVGGEGLDEQFEMITSNPDVIIATPGRLLHLAVEMNLDLKSIQYVVFDEADRLFEMGFATALDEILSRLPTTRQTLLFSATLPKTLVEFAKAGLQNPKLVRLDAESKISTDLRMAFFSVKPAEKDASLLLLLRDVIKVPLGLNVSEVDENERPKGKGKEHVETAPHQTLVFVATKHHVEYISNLLTTAGYAVSHIYGALDQVARNMQMDRFRRGLTNILVVTDVAARGIDIPVLENVVNYDFPQGSRIFVHRVGRTARAGRKGWAWTFITHTELPHMLDLQLFLARPIKARADGEATYTDSLVLGTFERDRVDEELEYVHTLHETNSALSVLREVMRKGQSMYERSQGKASQASYKRAKEMVKGGKWILEGGKEVGAHPIIISKNGVSTTQDEARDALLKVVNSFRPNETVFEIGTRGQNEAAALMQSRRKALGKAINRAQVAESSRTADDDNDDEDNMATHEDNVELADEADIEAVFETSRKRSRNDFKDSEFYMAYEQKDASTEKGYSLRDGASFTEQASQVTFDLTTDEGTAARLRRSSQMTWDKKKKKFVKGDGAGADNVKLVRTESGTRLPASYRSGRFDEWKKSNRKSLPRVGEAEPESAGKHAFGGGRRFKHNKITEAKPLDKLSVGYDRKIKQKRKNEDQGSSTDGKTAERPGRGRYGAKPIRQVKNELKTVDQIRRAREITAKRKAKNARPSRKKGKR